MKNIKQAIIGAVALSFASAIHTLAVEGLKISVPSTNVVLFWPSDPSESYLVQYRNTLNATDSWTTLADYFPADSSTNITIFVDPNPVEYGSSGGAGRSLAATAIVRNEMGLATPPAQTLPPAPMAIPANGSGDAVPLVLYPPGFDLSGFLILDPATGETVNGAGYSIKASSPLRAGVSRLQALDSGDVSGPSPSPMGGPIPSGGSGSTAQTPGTGFYRVVRDGVHLFGLTNGAVLSGVVKLPIELANGSGTVSTVSIVENETPIGNSLQITPNINPLSTILDTTLLANGVHMISASARWDDTNGGLWEAESPAVSVTISNEISFENWMPSFGETGNTFLFRATSAHPNTDWIVYVYDSNHTYLGYFHGHTDNGDISFYYDYSGTSLTNNPVFSFEIATEYIDPTTPKTYRQTDPWSGEGAWAMATQHAWDNASDASTLYQELNGFVDAAGSIGGVSPAPGSDGSPYALAFGSGDPAGDANWAAFRNAIFNSKTRNLVYFGASSTFVMGKRV
jgi:hypothetical protein